jgi:probable rRNA maturation factor
MCTEESLINYFSEDRPTPEITSKTNDWLIQIADSHNFTIEELNYIFCSDEYLLEVNKTYLQHDFYTDIITFDNSDKENTIESDIFISIDRVEENEKELDVPRGTEILRVIAHGLLHLCGFKDKTIEEATEMRKQEDACLSLWKEVYT